MCGIAGIVSLGEKNTNYIKDRDTIREMTRLIAHRGPDGEGIAEFDEGRVLLGHRRLSIIDLSVSASQPMRSLDGRFCITYNGEIYNYRELRQDLQSLGFVFRTNSDTEVVLNVYAQYGVNGLRLLNGMFAFAIWDDHEKEIVIARDRYGIKPLYYAIANNKLLFASEYKSILLSEDIIPDLNLHALKEYLTFQNIFSNMTLVKGINLLEAGCYMKFRYSNKEILPVEERYWDFCFDESLKQMTYDECKEELDRLFKQAVKRQLVSDVEVGSYLSGGIDSGSIVAIASKHLPNLKTFTCGFDLHSASGIELAYDEREKAEYMSYLFKTEHYEMVLKAGDMERCMNDLIWHMEDPRVGQSYPNYYSAKLSSNFVKVVLAGTAGDELFAGYPWRYYRAINCRTLKEYTDNYFEYWQRMLNHEELKRFLGPIYNEIRSYSVREVFKNYFREMDDCCLSPEQCVNYSLYLEAKTFLHGLLIVEDKLSMAHGLETRIPFLDNDLVDFAMRIPVRFKLSSLNSYVPRLDENSIGQKVDRYYDQNRDGKIILRDVMANYVSEEISKGRKQGFSAPDASWFKGESIEYVKSIISNPNSMIYEYIDKEAAEEAFREHTLGKKNNRLLIWSILSLEIWLETFLKNTCK